MKHICDFENKKVSLEVFECECGFHIGFDCTYLEQVGKINFPCPNCKKTFIIDEIE